MKAKATTPGTMDPLKKVKAHPKKAMARLKRKTGPRLTMEVILETTKLMQRVSLLFLLFKPPLSVPLSSVHLGCGFAQFRGTMLLSTRCDVSPNFSRSNNYVPTDFYLLSATDHSNSATAHQDNQFF